MLIDHNAKRYLDLCALTREITRAVEIFQPHLETFSSRWRASYFLFFFLFFFCRLEIKSRVGVSLCHERQETSIGSFASTETSWIHIVFRRRCLVPRAGNWSADHNEWPNELYNNSSFSFWTCRYDITVGIIEIIKK